MTLKCCKTHFSAEFTFLTWNCILFNMYKCSSHSGEFNDCSHSRSIKVIGKEKAVIFFQSIIGWTGVRSDDLQLLKISKLFSLLPTSLLRFKILPSLVVAELLMRAAKTREKWASSKNFLTYWKIAGIQHSYTLNAILIVHLNHVWHFYDWYEN